MVQRPSHKGFTLIEMIVVLMIAALMASVTVVSLSGTLHLASGKDLMDQLAELDRQCRRQVIHTSSACWLEFDLDRQHIRWLDSLEPVQVHRLWQPSGNWRLRQVATLDQTLTQGQLTLICSGQGWTPSYEVILDPQTNCQPVRFSVSGLTGQVRPSESEKPWRSLQQKVVTIVAPKTADTTSGGRR